MDQRIWKQVTIRVAADMEDPVSDFVTTLTQRGVCIREEPEVSVIDAYLEPGDSEDQILRIEKHLEDLRQMGLLPEFSRPTVNELPEEDWMAVFRSQHTTVRISDRLVIRPTWCDPIAESEIVLDPGLAFGTGSHPTTRMCLVLLDEIIGEEAPGRLFDLGTGSGILAMAGAFLGIEDVLAADIDATAVKVASDNVLSNAVGHRVEVVEGGAETAQGLYDIITANLSASLLKRLAPDMTRHLAPGGSLIISGILEDEEPQVTEAFTRCGLKVKRVMKEKVWVATLLVSPEGNE
jgi:ribosomal protein L11 methyltransferase